MRNLIIPTTIILSFINLMLISIGFIIIDIDITSTLYIINLSILCTTSLWIIVQVLDMFYCKYKDKTLYKFNKVQVIYLFIYYIISILNILNFNNVF